VPLCPSLDEHVNLVRPALVEGPLVGRYFKVVDDVTGLAAIVRCDVFRGLRVEAELEGHGSCEKYGEGDDDLHGDAYCN